MTKKEWFADWFNTPYYHTLYKHRDDQEAELFIKRLLDYLKLKSGTEVLDLACGKGRHSRMLHALGMRVTGLDLSEESIREAAEFSSEGLNFAVHDMRYPFEKQPFDVVFNLFTSFGYFDELEANEAVLKSIHQMLTDDGQLIIDFMNAKKVISQLVKQEEKTIDGITFKLERAFDGQHIHKQIRFKDNGRDFHFSERVQALTITEFTHLLNSTGFELIRTFGDFSLQPFNANESDRLIIHARRI